MSDHAAKWPPEYAEYPRILYKPGAAEDAWGVKVDTLTVNDDDELAAAMAEGWARTPNGNADVKPYSLLDQPVAEIIEVLPALTKDELVKLLADEQAGKTRKGLVAALDKAIEACDVPPATEPPQTA